MSILDTAASAVGSITDPIAALIKNPFSTSVGAGAERPNDFPGGFSITEYVDGVEQAATALRFIGNMMPFQPFKWGGEQRLVKEYYPGNPEAAVQVLGAKEGPLIIKGRWKDKRFKDPSYYGVAYQYSLATNEIRKRGNLVKFGMHGAAGDWFRWGFIEKAEFEMKKQSWIDYDIEFFVISENRPVNNYFASSEKQAPSAVNNDLINSAAAFQSKYSSVPKSMPQSIAGLLNGLISGVAKNINLVTGFVSTLIDTANEIESSALRALGLIKNARSSISRFSRQVDTLAHTYSNISKSGSPAQQVKDTFANIAHLQESMAATHQLSAYLARMQAQFEAIALTIPKARYRVKSGDTLQNISTKFYGSSEHWDKIYDHNKLQSTTLVSGAVLEIPRL